MGKHSGSAALRQRLSDLGFADLPKAQVADVFKRFKKVLPSCSLSVYGHSSCTRIFVMGACTNFFAKLLCGRS